MRSIEFIIPGIPEVVVSAVEQDDGTILFSLSSEGSDVRGLFFDVTGISSGLVVSGEDVTDSDFDTINLGGGVNMNGEGRDEYDVGVEFGTAGAGQDIVTSTSFTLASDDGSALTLDAITNQEFGIRLTSTGAKNTVIAPAAPDAIDDSVSTNEDSSITIDATGNDTDADGDFLTIVGVDEPTNGTATIVGNEIFYTPNENWSGTETFEYTISDGDGGSDVATVTVNVEAVADAPNLGVEVMAGNTVQEVKLAITSSLVDTDGSESLAIEIGGLPEGVTLVGAVDGRIENPTGLDYVTVVLPEGMSFDFDVDISAISTEGSNGDAATTSTTANVLFTNTVTNQQVVIEAVDQSQWGPGDEFTFDDERSFIFDTGPVGIDDDEGFVQYDFSVDLRAGLTSDLHFGGGEIDATVPYDLTFETAFNETTDMLSIDTSAFLADGGGFMTDGPELTYDLDFIYAASADAFFELGGFDFLDQSPSSSGSVPIIDFDSDTSPSIGASFPFGISGAITWPNAEVLGEETSDGLYSGEVQSNNFVDINLDVDDLIGDAFFGGVNPFDLTGTVNVLGAEGSVSLEVIDADLFVGANFFQDFSMEVGDLEAMLEFEDGSTQAFTFGDELIFDNAGALDADNDGNIDFTFLLDVDDTTVTNDTDIDFNWGWNFDAFGASYAWDIGIFGSGSDGFDPLIDLGKSNIPIAGIDVYSNSFELDFEETSYTLVA